MFKFPLLIIIHLLLHNVRTWSEWNQAIASSHSLSRDLFKCTLWHKIFLEHPCRRPKLSFTVKKALLQINQIRFIQSVSTLHILPSLHNSKKRKIVKNVKNPLHAVFDRNFSLIQTKRLEQLINVIRKKDTNFCLLLSTSRNIPRQ